MPELPEVETIRRDLLRRVVGRRFSAVEVMPGAEKVVAAPSPAEFRRALPGLRIEGIERRGKYLLFLLSDERYLIVHLRMTGALLHRSAGAPADGYLRVRLSLDDKTELRYTDARKLGMMWLVDDPAPVVGKLGPDALEGLAPETLRSRLDGRKAPVKVVLMDQARLAGLGNIYADEALFLASVHPRRPAGSLTADEMERLHGAVGKVLREAMSHRGSSFRDYVDAEGREGEHQKHVKVYRRTGEPCYNCGAVIERIKLGGRSSHFCPHCQK
jgi:formamidopyrimidine-DNA glycosylase